jgi:hypothetical protein
MIEENVPGSEYVKVPATILAADAHYNINNNNNEGHFLYTQAFRKMQKLRTLI